LHASTCMRALKVVERAPAGSIRSRLRCMPTGPGNRRRAALAIVAAMAAGAGSVLGVGPVSAKAPTPGLTKARPVAAGAILKAVNASNPPVRPAACFDIWLTKSSSQWATWTFSKAAYSKPECVVVDAYREFYRYSNGKWKWAGRFSGVPTPLCFFTPKASPGLEIQRDLGCA
jgi:hypothetical protein